jgi:hypothetical protein
VTCCSEKVLSQTSHGAPNLTRCRGRALLPVRRPLARRLFAGPRSASGGLYCCAWETVAELETGMSPTFDCAAR